MAKKKTETDRTETTLAQLKENQAALDAAAADFEVWNSPSGGRASVGRLPGEQGGICVGRGRTAQVSRSLDGSEESHQPSVSGLTG